MKKNGRRLGVTLDYNIDISPGRGIHGKRGKVDTFLGQGDPTTVG